LEPRKNFALYSTTRFAAAAGAAIRVNQVIHATSNPQTSQRNPALQIKPARSSYREETSAITPQSPEFPRCRHATQRAPSPRFRARSAGNLKMLTPTIEFTISAVKLQRPIVRTSPCGLSVKLIFPEATILRRRHRAAFIFTISASKSGARDHVQCGYLSPPDESTRYVLK